MQLYHDLITKKSWRVLRELKREADFILIGGWAVWLYAKTLKSKDIDLIVDFAQLETLKKKYDISKNNRLKKYETKIDEVSIDIYTPYYSHLGIPVEEIQSQVQLFEGFKVPQKEVLLILKQTAHSGRKLSIKGRKDLVDVFSLILISDFDWRLYCKLVKRYKLMQYIED